MHKITATTMSTTVAELHGLMRCYGSASFLRGLWSDITGEIADVHIRTDANNLVTTASTTHQPEQKETMHLIQMLRKESTSGQMHPSSATSLWSKSLRSTKATSPAAWLLPGFAAGLKARPVSLPCKRPAALRVWRSAGRAAASSATLLQSGPRWTRREVSRRSRAR